MLRNSYERSLNKACVFLSRNFQSLDMEKELLGFITEDFWEEVTVEDDFFNLLTGHRWVIELKENEKYHDAIKLSLILTELSILVTHDKADVTGDIIKFVVLITVIVRNIYDQNYDDGEAVKYKVLRWLDYLVERITEIDDHVTTLEKIDAKAYVYYWICQLCRDIEDHYTFQDYVMRFMSLISQLNEADAVRVSVYDVMIHFRSKFSAV